MGKTWMDTLKERDELSARNEVLESLLPRMAELMEEWEDIHPNSARFMALERDIKEMMDGHQ